MCIAYSALEICDANILTLKVQGIRISCLCLYVYILKLVSVTKLKPALQDIGDQESNYPVQPLFPCEAITGLPQRLPISPVHFTVYFAEIHEVEKQVEWCRGIPFVGDVTWLAEGASLNEESLYCLCIYFLYSFLYSTPAGKGAGGALLFIGGQLLGILGREELKIYWPWPELCYDDRAP